MADAHEYCKYCRATYLKVDKLIDQLKILEKIYQRADETFGEVIGMKAIAELTEENRIKEIELQKLKNNRAHEYEMQKLKHEHDLRRRKLGAYIKIASIISGAIFGSSGIIYLLIKGFS